MNIVTGLDCDLGCKNLIYRFNTYKEPIKIKTYKRIGEKAKRNSICSCGSGIKYKKCCGRS